MMLKCDMLLFFAINDLIEQLYRKQVGKNEPIVTPFSRKATQTPFFDT